MRIEAGQSQLIVALGRYMTSGNLSIICTVVLCGSSALPRLMLIYHLDSKFKHAEVNKKQFEIMTSATSLVESGLLISP